MSKQIADELNQLGGTRMHLLAAEQMDDERMQQLRKEVTAMFATKLTTRGRAWWTLGLGSSLLFIVLGIWGVLQGSPDESLRVIWSLYTLANAAMAVFSAYVLWRGVFDARWGLMLSKLSPAGSLFVALLLIIRAVSEPSLPALAWSVFGVLCVVIAIAIMLYSRVAVFELANREHLLRMELRLLELSQTLTATSAGRQDHKSVEGT